MTKLSVNINKIATLRNTRDNNIPDLLRFTRLALDAGAQGITIHPRPDERHIRTSDVAPITQLVRSSSPSPAVLSGRGQGEGKVELNFEGNPFEGKYLDLCLEHRPDQATLVPDSINQSTSDHGWNLSRDGERLRPIIEKLQENGSRVSLFMDFDSTEFHLAHELGVERIELYTEPFAQAFSGGRGASPVCSMPSIEVDSMPRVDDRRDACPTESDMIQNFGNAARRACDLGLEVNAGHDLNLDNLGVLLRAAPAIAEVSIGHALIADALEFGLTRAIQKYLEVIGEAMK